MNLSTFRDTFNPSFEHIVHTYLEEEKGIVNDVFLHHLLNHVEELLKGGKRLRPYLAWLGYAAGGNTPHDNVIHMGAALEIFHGFCLIHDDIIDKAQTRRGVPTIEHHTFAALTRENRYGDNAHTARSQAILVGDLLLSWANECAAQASEEKPAALKQFFTMAKEVVGGQMIDVDTTTREEQDLTLLERKMYLKTAGYSFVHPLSMGVHLANPPHKEDLLTACATIGSTLGVAFQLQDDLFDVTKTAQELGKPTLSDIREGQQTYLTAYLATHGSNAAKELLQKIMRGKGTEEEIAHIKVAMEESGACEKTDTRIRELFAQAKEEITASPFPAEIIHELLQLATLIEHRSS